MRLIQVILLAALATASHATLTQVWSHPFLPTGATSSSWQDGAIAPNDDVVLLGSSSGGSGSQSMLRRYTSAGLVAWDAPAFPPQAFFGRIAFDAAGNVYLSGSSGSQRTIASYAAATGALRWMQSYGPGAYDSLAVKNVGNSIFVYGAGRTSFTGPAILTRVNSATGALVNEITLGTPGSKDRVVVTTDLNGNPLVATSELSQTSRLGYAAKFTQGLVQVYRTPLPLVDFPASSRADSMLFIPESNEILVGATGIGPGPDSPRLVHVLATTGAVIGEDRIPVPPASIDDVVFTNLRRGFGNGATVRVRGTQEYGVRYVPGRQLDIIVPPTFSGFDLVQDGSFQHLFGEQVGDKFRYKREVAAALVSVQGAANTESFISGLLIDSQQRVVSFGGLSGQAFVRQDAQGLVVNNDTFGGVFPSTLDVSAPGVLENDAAWVGGTVTLVDLPANGTVVLDPDGGFTYSSNSNIVGPDTFTYRVTKGTETDIGTVNILYQNVASIDIVPAPVFGGTPVTGTISTNFRTPQAITIFLASNKSSLIIPNSVVIPVGEKSATFSGSTQPVNSDNIVIVTATFRGVSKTRSLTLRKGTLTSFTLSSPDIIGGILSGQQETVTALASLNVSRPAPVIIGLTLDPILTGPTSIAIEANTSSNSVLLRALDVLASTTAQVTASQTNGPSITRSITVHPQPRLIQFTVDKSTQVGGSPITGTVLLSRPHSVQMNPFVMDVIETATFLNTPLTVSVAPGAIKASFTIITAPVGAVSGASVKVRRETLNLSQLITVIPNPLQSVSVTPSQILGGNGATGTVTLNNLAPPSGLLVGLASSSNALKVPSKGVVISSGSWSGTFAVTTLGVASPINVTVTASLAGLTRTAIVRLNP